MGVFALTATVVLYLATALDFWWKGDGWMAGAFIAYALANVCFIGTLLK